MRGSKFYLNFRNDQTGRIQISEPIGFDGADFAIIQENGRMGRDQEFAGGEGKFQFSKMMHPEVFDHLQRYFVLYGTEAVVDLEIDYSGNGDIVIIGNLDYPTCQNNTFDLIKFDVIIDQKQSLIKNNIEAKTDLFSPLDIDGASITPVTTKKILLKAKSREQKSKWITGGDVIASGTVITFSNDVLGVSKTRRGVNNANKVVLSGIDNTLSFISPFYGLIPTNGGVPDNGLNFTYLEAEDTLTNVNIRIYDLIGFSFQSYSNGQLGNNPIQVTSGSGYVKLQVVIGENIESPDVTIYDLYTRNFGYTQSSPSVNFPTSFPDLIIPLIPRGHRVWIYVNTDANATFSGTGGTGNYIVFASMTKMTVEITATSTSYNTVNEGVRLIDAIRYNIKSSAKTNVSFPMAEEGGLLYNQFLFNGNLLRNLIDKPFYLTFKDITEWFPELHLDYEIQRDGTIYIGSYANYYPSTEMAVIGENPMDGDVFDDFEKPFNEEFQINIFEYKNKNYQSQREGIVANTYDGISGEAQYKLLRGNVNAKKEVEVEFIRDSFLLEENRISGFRREENSASRDDDKIFIVDVYPKELLSSDLSYTENDFLQHSFDPESGNLTLRNTGTFRFDFLGMSIGSIFIIIPNQLNAGSYNVVSFTANSIVLDPVSASPSIDNNGERFTGFTYTVSLSTITGVSWTNEQFNEINNIANPESFANMRFSVGRNIRRAYESYLATANLYNKNTPIRNIFYKNNPDAYTVLNGNAVLEGSSFVPANPILSPFLVKMTFIVTFERFYDIFQKVRSSERGYIRCFDPFGNVLKLYPQEMKFRATAERVGTMTLTGKEKYEQSLLNIEDGNENFITLNNEYIVEFLRYEEKNNYFYIKDQNGKLLYNKLLFNQISLNGAIASNETELKQWLNLLTE